MTAPPEPSIRPLSREAGRKWLRDNRPQTAGVWRVSYEKAKGKPRFDDDAAVEEAWCFGWIDSQPNELDAEHTLLRLAPRKPGTGGSRPNKLRIKTMTAAGPMADAGLCKVVQARRDGSRTQPDAVEAPQVPQDRPKALQKPPPARKHVAAFPCAAKRGILEWTAHATTAETRARRVGASACQARQNERASQWRRPTSPWVP